MQIPFLLATIALTTAAPLPGFLDSLTSKLAILKDTLSPTGDVTATGTNGDTANIGSILGDIDSSIAELVNTGDLRGVGAIGDIAPVVDIGGVASGNDVDLSELVETGDVLSNVQLPDFWCSCWGMWLLVMLWADWGWMRVGCRGRILGGLIRWVGLRALWALMLRIWLAFWTAWDLMLVVSRASLGGCGLNDGLELSLWCGRS